MSSFKDNVKLYHCACCGKPYRRAFALIKHVHLKHNDSNKGEN